MILTIEKIQEEAKKMIASIYKNEEYKFGETDDTFDDGHDRITNHFFDHTIDSCVIIPESIEISEDNCTFHEDDDIFDLLGVYRYQAPNTEGKIILFKECIEKFGKYFYEKNSYRKSFSTLTDIDCINMVYKIVLWHELGHWITHWMIDSNQQRWDDRFWELRPNPNDLLEGLAQLFTYYMIIRDSDKERIKFVFEFMLLGQRAPYHKHVEIIESDYFSWINSFKALELIRADKYQTLYNYINYLKPKES
jgi:hypothetical protein